MSKPPKIFAIVNRRTDRLVDAFDAFAVLLSHPPRYISECLEKIAFV
jgi:hypothetical protein